MDHSVCAPSQWKMALHRNTVRLLLTGPIHRMIPSVEWRSTTDVCYQKTCLQSRQHRRNSTYFFQLDVTDHLRTRNYKDDSRFAPSQWETTLPCNDVSHWLATNLESAMKLYHTGQLVTLIQSRFTSHTGDISAVSLHTADLLTHPYNIRIVAPKGDLLTHPCDSSIVAIPERRLFNSPSWHKYRKNDYLMTNSSVWHIRAVAIS